MLLKIFSLNLKEYEQREERLPKIIAEIKSYEPDIIVVQEVVFDKEKSPLSTLEQINEQLKYPHAVFCPCFDYSLDYGKGVFQPNSVLGGLGVLSQLPFSFEEQNLPIAT